MGHVSVEDAVLEQYKLQGWKGISDECRVFKYFHRFIFNLLSLMIKTKNRIFFAALLIDEIFADIDDVFPFPLQAGPLDMGTPQFSARRKRLLDRRLRQIKAFDDKQMSEAVRQGWQRIYCNIDYFLHSFKIN